MDNTINLSADHAETIATKLSDVILKSDSQGGDMWKGRVLMLIQAFMPAIVENLKQSKSEPTLSDFRNSFDLPNVLKIARSDSINAKKIRDFLLNLPGVNGGVMTQKFIEQYGFLVMQISRTINEMIVKNNEDLGYDQEYQINSDLLIGTKLGFAE